MAVSDELINHELIHVDQIRRSGVIRFYVKYVLEYTRNRRRGLSHDEAYRSISFEIEAYTHQNDLAYLEKKSGATKA